MGCNLICEVHHGSSSLEQDIREGENPVDDHGDGRLLLCDCIGESGCLRVQPKIVGKFQLKLNIDKRPIANKYREGKMKRTLKRE